MVERRERLPFDLRAGLHRWVERQAAKGTFPARAGLRLCQALTHVPLLGGYAHTLAGAMQSAAGLHDDAIANYESALARGRSRHAGVHYGLGLARLRARDPAGAEPSLRRAMELAPEREWTYWRLAECLLKLNRPVDAEWIVRSGMAQHPDSHRLGCQLADALIRQRRFLDAVDQLIDLAALPKLGMAGPLPGTFPWYWFDPEMATPSRVQALRDIVDRHQKAKEVRIFLAHAEYALGHHEASTRRLYEAAALHWRGSKRIPKWDRPKLPSFLIIGQAKSGTSALFNSLSSHVTFEPPLYKEPQFWSVRYSAGLDWYRAHFPPISSDLPLITGEASISYFHSTEAPERIAAHKPDMRLILLLRDPVDRAYSHYWMSMRHGSQYRSWDEVVEADLSRWPACPLDPGDLSSGPPLSNYLMISAALPHLKRWLAHFPKEQMLILRTRDLAHDVLGTLDRVCDFLGLAHFVPRSTARVNVGSYPPMDPDLEQRLREWFVCHERNLEAFLVDHWQIHG